MVKLINILKIKIFRWNSGDTLKFLYGGGFDYEKSSSVILKMIQFKF